MTELPRSYDAHGAFDRHAATWDARGYSTPRPEDAGDPYCIVIPPPNVTGRLHMGHALDNTLQDVLIRYHRALGFNALWIPGTDHAGIATQWVVDRMLRDRGIDRHVIGREAFLEHVWAWKEESGGAIQEQLRRLACSCDWSRERFTMDPGLSRAVREVFVRLYEQGLIYRDTRMIHWDPVGLTVLSDLEVEHEADAPGELWSFAYRLADDPSVEIVVATTRPETMLGDTAVAVHPEDPRYQHLIGRLVEHPFTDRKIPIIGDATLVDPAFGTGAVKVTPAHDPNDYEVGKRHDLPFITMFDLRAHVIDAGFNEAGRPFVGLERTRARKAVKAAVADLGLDRGTKPHSLAIGRSQRSGAVVEPMVSTQWFVRMKPLAGPALAAVEHGFTRFVPAQWENTYFAWMRDIRDWCISRQLWWGHQIPAWYCADCDHVTVSREDPSACAGCGGVRLRRDEDVLDTWFSSALWPFSTMGWPDRTADLARWYPTSVLVTGFDIIFFWVARMMVAGTHFLGSVPFKDVCIHGLIRDGQGQKMSKTKGNVVDPLGVIERHGVDAFRFTLVSHTVQGRDYNWNEHDLEVAGRFVNKVWQSFRFLHMNLDGYDPTAAAEPSVYDRWILARAGQAAARVRGAFTDYRFDEACRELHAFTWGELCDWYLELSKPAMNAGGAVRQAAQHTLLAVAGAVARLLHPVMPVFSEEMWQFLPEPVRRAGLRPGSAEADSIVLAAYPHPGEYPDDPRILEEVALLQEVVTAVRRLRNDLGVSPAVPMRLLGGSVLTRLDAHRAGLEHLARVSSLEAWEQQGAPPNAAALVVSGATLYVPLDGLVDLAAEKERLDKELERVRKDVADLQQKLGNADFVARAPAEVVERFRTRLDAAQERLVALTGARACLV